MNVACDAASTCPNDPPPTQADVDECHTEAAGSCAGAVQSYRNCYVAQRVCAYDGTTDVHATEEACGGEATSVYACVDGGQPPWLDAGLDGRVDSGGGE
jgi:hypothetical protein